MNDGKRQVFLVFLSLGQMWLAGGVLAQGMLPTVICGVMAGLWTGVAGLMAWQPD